jgi:hypothetical protein
MRTFVGDDEFVQPKRNETAPWSECRPTLKNALTQPRLLEMDVKPASRTSDCGQLIRKGFSLSHPSKIPHSGQLTGGMPFVPQPT